MRSLGKHPRARNWQITPLWDDEQMDNIEDAGWFASGYGVLMRGLIVIDIDVRNGGNEGYAQLVSDIPEVAGAGLIVESGRGDGGRHLYFSLSEPLALMTHHASYRGWTSRAAALYVVRAPCTQPEIVTAWHMEVSMT